MGRIITTDIFIQKAQKIHGTKYDYSKTIYMKTSEKVKIICPIHGLFFQRPNDHLDRSGCPKCGWGHSVWNEDRKLLLEQFIIRSKKVHGNKYNYSQTIYNGLNKKVIIGCPKHGFFEQIAVNHMKGHGCPKCGRYYSKIAQLMTVEEFISKSEKVHGNNYNYSKTIYKGNKKKIEIICRTHGSFFQTPNEHLVGKGCSKCVRKNETELGENLKIFFIGWEIKRQKKFYSKEHKRYRSFDYFLKNKTQKIIIEYDGQQHFEPVQFNGISLDKSKNLFKKQKETDSLDKLFCKRKNIDLYRISYKDDMKLAVKDLAANLV